MGRMDILPASRLYFTPLELFEAPPDDAYRASMARREAVKFIVELCHKLRFPLRTEATALMLYHRFFAVYSILQFSTRDVSIVATFVAGKMEETLKKLRDILIEAYTIETATSHTIPDDNVLERERRRLLTIEPLLLQSMCFDFEVKHAYAYIIDYAKRLNCSKEAAKFAWHLARKSYEITLCIQYPTHMIACACLILGMLLKDESISAVQRFWWIKVYTRYEDLIDILRQLLEFLGEPYTECLHEVRLLEGPETIHDEIERLKATMTNNDERRSGFKQNELDPMRTIRFIINKS